MSYPLLVISSLAATWLSLSPDLSNRIRTDAHQDLSSGESYLSEHEPSEIDGRHSGLGAAFALSKPDAITTHVAQDRSSPALTEAVAQSTGGVAVPRLRPGAYYRGAYVSIYEHDGQFCYSGFSRNGSLIASISEDPNQPNVYFFDSPEARRTPIFQVDANTLSFGDNSRYERINDAQPFEQLNIDSDLYACLTSVEPFYQSEEHTGRQRPPQNR